MKKNPKAVLQYMTTPVSTYSGSTYSVWGQLYLKYWPVNLLKMKTGIHIIITINDINGNGITKWNTYKTLLINTVL